MRAAIAARSSSRGASGGASAIAAMRATTTATSAMMRATNASAMNRGYSVVAEARGDGEDVAQEPRAEENKLYIGNLSWNTTNESLGRVFADFDVKDASVVVDKLNGRSRGFAFVTVGSAQAMTGAIEALDGKDVDGREIRVSAAQSNRDRQETRGDRPDRERPPMRTEGFREGGRREERRRPGMPLLQDKRRVYFGNLSWGMDHLDLQDLCAEFGSVEDSRLITDRETGRSRGFGFVTMSSEAEAEEVVNQLNGQDVDGRVLRVNIANSE